MLGEQLKLFAEGEEKTIPPQKMMRCVKPQHPAHQVLLGTLQTTVMSKMRCGEPFGDSPGGEPQHRVRQLWRLQVELRQRP